jgi:uncharacterized protein (DUF1501 family)
MISLYDGSSRLNRRQLLSIGSLALGGLSLSSLLEARAATSSLTSGKSVIFLFQQGGPSQFETFDPKPDAPDGIRTITGVTQTSVPGVLFGDTLSQLAPLAHKLTIIRNFQTGNGAHNIRPIVGPESLEANIGTLYSRVAGPTNPDTSMPTNAVLYPQSVCNDVAQGQGRGDLSSTGAFGGSYAPFVPGGSGQLQRDLRLNLSPERFQDRRELSNQLNRLRGKLEADEQCQTFDRFQQQAADALTSGRVADALDLSREDPRVLAKYDTAKYVPAHKWERAARGKRGYYSGHTKSLGKLMLMARRLCEAGCGFVTIHAGYEGVWDMHADGNNLNMVDGMQAVGTAFDHVVAAFINDIESRGLQDKIMLIATGEMGRTPRLNKNGGRDHWGKLTPLMVYGGGAARGRVIGQSTRDGGEPNGDPYTTRNLVSTILHTMLDPAQVRLVPGLSQIARLAEVSPIQLG